MSGAHPSTRPSFRPDVVANLSVLQSRLDGGRLDTVLAPSDVPPPRRSPGLVLEHVAGLSAGGSVPLELGSYRFGRSSSSVLFDAGATSDPQFGLTVAPGGAVTLYPRPGGVVVDGGLVTEPTPLHLNQTVTVDHDRFLLSPRDRLRVARSLDRVEQRRPMPQPGIGPSVDRRIVDWADSRRTADRRTRWAGLVGPADLHRRITGDRLFGLDWQAPTFGHALVGTADLPFDPPVELREANRATRDEVAMRFPTVVGAPVVADLARTSLAVVGADQQAKPVVAWLAINLAVTHNPADLTIAVDQPVDPGYWHWLDRFPHANSAGLTDLTVTIVDHGTDEPVDHRGTVAVVRPGAPIADEFGVVLTVTERSASLHDRSTGRRIEPVTAIGMSYQVALERSMMVAQRLTEQAG